MYRVIKHSLLDEASRPARDEWWTVEERRRFLWFFYWRPLKKSFDSSGGSYTLPIEFTTVSEAWEAVRHREQNHGTGYHRWIEKRKTLVGPSGGPYVAESSTDTGIKS